MNLILFILNIWQHKFNIRLTQNSSEAYFKVGPFSPIYLDFYQVIWIYLNTQLLKIYNYILFISNQLFEGIKFSRLPLSQVGSNMGEELSKTRFKGNLSAKDHPMTTGTGQYQRTIRKQASSAFEVSHNLEKIYVTRKGARLGKSEARKAKEHFQISRKSFFAGITCLMRVIANLPAIIEEKREYKRHRRLGKRSHEAETR